MNTKYFTLIAAVALSLILTACSAVSTPSPASNSGAPENTATPAPPLEPTNTPLPPAGGAKVDITIQGFAFSPADITVKAGTTVVWTNQDSASHTVVADDGGWKSGGMAKGESFSRVFDTPGTYPYHCGIHPNMKGTITVTS
jgi:plastocyanin